VALDDSPSVEFVFVETTGDRLHDVSIRSLPERGAFANAVDRAVAQGQADVAVHSAKDLPTNDPLEGLTLCCVPERVDARDALIGSRLEDLSPGSVIATGAVRRRVQLAWLRPDLTFKDLRGNIATRLKKVPKNGAVVVALAAMLRLEMAAQVTEVLSLEVMLSQVGQGAIALRCRNDDAESADLLARIDDRCAHRALLAERAFLRRCGGGCDAPVAAHAHAEEENGAISIEGMVASGDGHVVLRRRHEGVDPEKVGTELATLLLVNDGGASLIHPSERP
jgi:hydroxymethylbilane synthase